MQILYHEETTHKGNVTATFLSDLIELFNQASFPRTLPYALTQFNIDCM